MCGGVAAVAGLKRCGAKNWGRPNFLPAGYRLGRHRHTRAWRFALLGPPRK